MFLQTLAFYYVNEQHLKDLGSHFLETAFGPSVWIQVHIDLTKFGATAFIISFLRLWCGAHLIHQPTADNLVEPANWEGLIAFMSAYRDAMPKNIKIQILSIYAWMIDMPWMCYRNSRTLWKNKNKNKKQNKTKNERDCMRGNEGLVQISLK